MKRRAFIKSMGLGGASVYIPASITMSSLLNEAYAAGPDYSTVSYTQPAILPQVINIFLYGGPSELAANLTNMRPENGDLNAKSQVEYDTRVNGITRFLTDNNGRISPRGFWLGAGGAAMEFLVKKGHMTVYRTMNKRGENTQSHRQSIFMNQKGSLDIENSPGVGTRLAKILETQYASGNLNFDPGLLILPFVSFEGETVFYAPDPDTPISALTLKPVTMRFSDGQFNNPYSRDANPNLSDMQSATMDNLVSTVEDAAAQARFSKVHNSFQIRKEMEQHLSDLGTSLGSALPIVTDPDDQLDDVQDDNGTLRLVYPNNSFSNQIRAAVTLAIENPDTKFITVSNGGLGGFDDHNNGVDNYPDRMENLFNSLRAAMKHIKYSNGTTPGGLARNTDNIIINVFGDFGRRANLNNSMGWDHGNCQVFYTLGGQALRPTGALGKIVGRTMLTGQTKTNDQYMVPERLDNDDPNTWSYEFEPMSMASSIYRYFGVQNPEVLTADPTFYPNGVGTIDETKPAEALLFPDPNP